MMLLSKFKSKLSMLLSDTEKIIDRLKQVLGVKSDGQPAKYWCWPQTGGVSPISTNLYLRRGTVEGLLKKMNIEHRTSNVQHRIMMSLRSAI